MGPWGLFRLTEMALRCNEGAARVVIRNVTVCASCKNLEDKTIISCFYSVKIKYFSYFSDQLLQKRTLATTASGAVVINRNKRAPARHRKELTSDNDSSVAAHVAVA